MVGFTFPCSRSATGNPTDSNAVRVTRRAGDVESAI